MQQAVKKMPTAERIAQIRAGAEAMGVDPDEAERDLLAPSEMWMSDRYTAIISREGGNISCISVRRNDRRPDIPWRHLQAIKSEIAGDEAEAVELFPAESRLVDTANQRWLWIADGMVRVGFNAGRQVGTNDTARLFGARQTDPTGA